MVKEKGQKLPPQARSMEGDRDDAVCTKYTRSASVGSEDSPKDKTVCPRCQSPNRTGSFFCYSCGKYFATADITIKSKGKGKRGPGTPHPPPKAKVIMPNGTEFVLSGDPVFIERADFADMLPYETLMAVSRQHLLITCSRGKYYVQDYGPEGKGSTNHTKLNDIDIHGRKKPLKDGDKIELAGQPELTLTFRLLEDTEKAESGGSLGDRL